MLVVTGLLVMVVLGVAGSLHLHRDTPVPSGLRRARSSPDGGYVASNTDRLEAAQRKRARRAERNLQIAGRRRSRHLENGQPPPSVRWWRRTARRRPG